MNMVRLNRAAAPLLVRGGGQIARIGGSCRCRCWCRMEYISIRIWFDVFFLAGEVIVVAFGAELGADGAWLASGAFALARLAGRAGDARALSYGGIGHCK